jgi:hypothetical protein
MKLAMTIAAAGLALFVAAPAFAQQQTQAQQGQQSAPPIPPLRCDMTKMMACQADGTCKSATEIAGMKLPMKVTVDFENTIVAAVDESGYARTDHADAVVKTGAQIMLHGIDGEFSWQMMISDETEAGSLVMSNADSSLVAFGSCTNK